MAKKIDIKSMISSDDNLKSLKKIEFSFKKNKSSDTFDNDIGIVLEIFGKLYIGLAINYYLLKTENSKLDKETKNSFKADHENLVKYISDDCEPGSGVFKVLENYKNKFFLLDLTKKEYSSKKHIIFDDNSSEHLLAFNAESIAKIPDKNILMKFTYNQNHLRCGLEINNKTITVTVVDIFNKNRFK